MNLTNFRDHPEFSPHGSSCRFNNVPQKATHLIEERKRERTEKVSRDRTGPPGLGKKPRTFLKVIGQIERKKKKKTLIGS